MAGEDEGANSNRSRKDTPTKTISLGVLQRIIRYNARCNEQSNNVSPVVRTLYLLHASLRSRNCAAKEQRSMNQDLSAKKSPILMLAVLYGSAFVAAFNENTVNVALVSIMREFAIDANTAQWLVTGYMIVTAIVVTITAFLLKRLRLRTLFLLPASVIIVVLMVLGIAFIRNIAKPEAIKLDVLSVVLSAIGLFLFVYGLSLVMSDPAIAAITAALGLCAIALFVRRQYRIPDPLLDLSPMHNRLFIPVCLLVIVTIMTTFSMSVLLPLYFEGVLGTTAFLAGALLLAPILVNAVTSLIGGRMMDKKGSWPLLFVGFAIIAIGQLGVCLVSSQLSLVGVLIASIVVYAGVGLVLSPAQTAGLQTLRPEENPHGVAILTVFIQIAASLGPSLFIGVLSSVAGGAEAAGASAMMAQAEGFASAVVVATAIAAVGAVTAFIYGRKRRRLANAERASAPAVASTEESPVTPEAAIAPQDDQVILPADVSALRAVDLMKAPYVVSAEDSVCEVMAHLIERKTSGLPVVDTKGSIVGFVTDGDLMAALGKPNVQGFDLAASLAVIRDPRNFDERFEETLAANVMEIATVSVVSVSENTSIDDICALLSNKRIKKVPVLSGKQVVGTVSRGDIVRTLMHTAINI